MFKYLSVNNCITTELVYKLKKLKKIDIITHIFIY